MNRTKPFLTIDEQLKLLTDRKFIISPNETERAKKFLLHNNYYRISGYTLTLRHNDVFLKDANLSKLIQIYEADRRMRHIMLSIIEVVEIKIKTLLAYFHCEKHGPLGYLDINNFYCLSKGKIDMDTIKHYQRITYKANNQKNSMTESEPYLKHHKQNKDDILPFWVYVELLTISDATRLYSMIHIDSQRTIANEFNFRVTSNNEILKNLLRCVTILRNICAHGGRLYGRLFITKPHLSTKEKRSLRIENGSPVLDRLFSYILVLKQLTTPHDFKIIKDHIIEIHKDYPLIDFKHYGFPDQWKESL